MNKKTGFISVLATGILAVLLLGSAGSKNTVYERVDQIQQETVKKDLPSKTNEAFAPGEVLTYSLHYGMMDAAVAVLEVKKDTRTIAGRECYQIVGNGYSRGTFDWFFKVRDRYETYMDKDALVPWLFVRRCYEGGYVINQDYVFNHFAKKVDVGGGEQFPIIENTQDMISAFYSARNIDFSNAKEGDLFSLNCFLDKENWPLKIKYVGKETISTELGKIRCIKFRPIVQKGRIFKKEEDLNVWISDDKNHVPIRAQAKVMIGSIKMDILSHKNLANPLAIVN
ncbi:MAG: DUF3108 domain-containing protein [Bacteroidia bacterium]